MHAVRINCLEPTTPYPVSTHNADEKTAVFVGRRPRWQLDPARARARRGSVDSTLPGTGIAGRAQLLADQLYPNLIKQNYSRLVIDCNRVRWIWRP
jgi:hypothetical protein